MSRDHVNLLCLLLVLLAPSLVRAHEVPQVFVIHSYSHDYAWTHRQHDGFFETLEAEYGGSLVTTEYLDTKRRRYTREYALLTAEHLRVKYAGYQPDAIYATDDDALRFALDHLASVFPGATVFFSGVNDLGVLDQITGHPVTGVFERKQIRPNLELLQAMGRDKRPLVLLGDDSTTYKAVVTELKQDLAGNTGHVIHHVSSTNLAEVLQGLADKRGSDVILTTLGGLNDDDGRVVHLREVLRRIVELNDGITLTMEDAYLVEGVVGGYVTSGRRQGAAAAELLIEWLQEDKLPEPVTESPNEYLFDGHALSRHELVLPPAVAAQATMVNPLPTLFERQRTLILGTLMVTIAMLLMSLAASSVTLAKKNRQVRQRSRIAEQQAAVALQATADLNEAQKIAGQGSWQFNLATERFTWSEGLQHLCGTRLKAGEETLESFFVHLPTQARQAFADAIEKVRNNGTAHECTHPLQPADGEELLVHETVRLVRNGADDPGQVFGTVQDITAISRAQTALEDKTTYLDGILTSSEKVSIIATDRNGRIQYFNPPSEALFGMPAEQVLGLDLMTIHRGRGMALDPEQLGLERAREDGEYRFSMEMERDDGTHVVDARISPIYRRDKEFAGYMLMCEDVTEQRRAIDLVEYHASYDPLTDLPNRRLFKEQLQKALARSRRHDHQCAVLFLDLDNFKTINDSLGHPVGDQLLTTVAERIKKTLREEDTVARIGGDEFVILLSELADERQIAADDARSAAEKVRTTLTRPYSINGQELHISPSIGIAVFPSADESADDILRQADTAMYQAKASGRNAVRFFLPSMQEAADRRLRTINELRQAVPGGQLRLHYQPQFDGDRVLTGFEALLRWEHPEHGLLLPGDFIDVAEEAGLILPVGDWVMHAALRQVCSWHGEFSTRTVERVAVNVSALQFRQTDFAERVEQALAATHADPGWLTLEMTESILLDDFEDTITKINQLRALGVRFSIDDFGTGYSSLAYLKRLPVDEIKIDRSFVRDVIDDANDAALVETILTLSRHMNLDIVAEGVETAEVCRFLSERGCTTFQGYHFGRPCPPDQFALQFLGADSQARAAKHSGH